MAESFMAESFFKSLEEDSSLVGLSACGCAQTGVDPMTFSNSEMILPYLSSNDQVRPKIVTVASMLTHQSLAWTRIFIHQSAHARGPLLLRLGAGNEAPASAGEPRMMGAPARMRQWPIRCSHDGQASPRSMQTRRLKPALRTTTPTFNFQPSMIKQEQDMNPHRHCCHPQTHARMIHEFV
ncbi:MAG: hypothetical protein NTW21_16440 [Verrucomicrobia bacterium]|nr:hypothetical protein [Verrucomicrobiota bacterium]